jgi:dTDP-4-dehydrorhamnose 3,5-epimerase
MHFQTKPHELKKIIYCVEGEILDVFLDVRFASKTFGQFGSIKLKEGEAKSIFIPNGFAHGYATISNNSKVVYLQSGNYMPDYEYTINPMSIEFDWLVNEPTMSKKDSISISFDKFADNQD